MLLTTRRLIFDKAGCTVFKAESFANAMLVLMNHQVDVLPLCHSLDDDQRRKILEAAAMLQPEIKCASLSFNWCDVITDDEYIHGWLNEPPSLLAAIERMFEETASRLSANLHKQ
jgi:hypothetical protein